MIKTTPRVTGVSLPETAFRVYETDKTVDVAAVFEVLKGNLAAYRVRGFVPPDVCRRIVENFWASPDRVPRYGEGEDGVEAYLIGASHYGKPTLQYLEEARACEDAVKNLYAGTVNPASVFRETLASGSAEAVSLRPAMLGGLAAGDTKAIYWNNTGTFLLEPHDDLAQMKDPIQNDFEIQQAARVMALNIYAEVPVNSGQVRVWNIQPDDRTRADLGLSHVGFPYPAEPLAEYPSIVIPVETGDLCVMNGNLVHAVLRGAAPTPKKRLLITCFMTLNARNELIWWT
jgi:hypothetical protein